MARSYNAGNMPKGYLWIMETIPGYQSDDCLLWPFSCCTPGYGIFMIDRKNRLSHRYVCEMTRGPAPGLGYHAAHSCGNRRCVNPRHLSWKTQRDNQLDRRSHGTNNKGSSKITQMQANQIRTLKGIETAIETAARYGVTESNVRLIQSGRTWANNGKIHKWTPEDDKKIREAVSKGYNFRQMAEFVGQARGPTMLRAYRIGLRSGQAPHPRKPAPPQS